MNCTTPLAPQDDLFRYVNGTWIENTEIPADKSRYGTFDILADGSEAAIHEILEESLDADRGSEARKIGDLYASFLDEDRVNELGASPLADRLAQVAAVSSIAELLELIGPLQRRGGPRFLHDLRRQRPRRPLAIPHHARTGRPLAAR